jgi:hypothetical protein
VELYQQLKNGDEESIVQVLRELLKAKRELASRLFGERSCNCESTTMLNAQFDSDFFIAIVVPIIWISKIVFSCIKDKMERRNLRRT